MKIDLPPGHYVLAVSGGVDSVVLLHMATQLAEKKPGYKYVVAHFDHGIREDSSEDAKYVQRLAEQCRLPFACQRGRLGAGASEALARKVRYAFLHEVRRSSGARAVVTAHHQDDLLETAMLNMIRGTHGRGLYSLRSRSYLARPLLNISKKQIVAYARQQGLTWREDSTNTNKAILRNYLRARYVQDMNKTRRGQLLGYIRRSAELHSEIDRIVAGYLHLQPHPLQLQRNSFIRLPHIVAREVMSQWLRLRANNIELSRRQLERLVVAAKTGRSGARVDVVQGYRLEISADTVDLARVGSRS